MNFLVKLIFEPFSGKYNTIDLDTKNNKIKRNDHTLISSRNKKLELSIYKSENENKKIILFLNGNQGTRKTMKYLVDIFLPRNIHIACFDFNG